MQLVSVHFNFQFRQGLLRNKKRVSSYRRALSDARPRFVEHSNLLSYHRPFGIREEGTKLSAPSEVALEIARSFPEEIYRQNSFAIRSV